MVPREAESGGTSAAWDPEEGRRVQARDPEALGRLFERHFDRLFALAHRLTGSHAAAEDVVQEAFLRLHRSAGRLDPARDPGAWLTTIVVNLCRDRWRSGAHRIERRSAPLDAAALGGALPSAPASDEPEAVLLRSERERLVHEALLELPPDLREVVVLRDWQGLGHEEIAALCGISHAAARKRYSRGLERLGALLEEVIEP
jgi:RNA polymerase sigma-70 factor (ECF subfamily)